MLLGRPKGTRFDALDLIVPMPQDRVPDAPNVLPLTMPLADSSLGRQARAGSGSAPWGALPRPWTALLIGGATGHHHFDVTAAATLGRDASATARAHGGSLLVTTSRRTGAAATQALRAALSVPHHFHAYVAGDAPNPLPVWLKQADDFIVTSDSASMLAEAWRSGRPVQVAVIPPKPGLRPLLKRTALALSPNWLHADLVRRGLVSAPVNLAAWVEARIADGHFGRLGGPPPRLRPGDAGEVDDIARVVARIRPLLAGRAN